MALLMLVQSFNHLSHEFLIWGISLVNTDMRFTFIITSKYVDHMVPSEINKEINTK